MSLRYAFHIRDWTLTLLTLGDIRSSKTATKDCQNMSELFLYLNYCKYTHLYVLYFIVVGSSRLVTRMHCSRRLIVQTPVFSRSYLHRQVSPPEILVVKGGITWARNVRWILPENARLPRNIQRSFTCRESMTWDKRLYFPSEGMRAEEFFALKNPTASAGFEPANLGTKRHTCM